VHDEACPEIGPICAVRDEPPQQHHTSLWLFELRLLAEYGIFEKLAVEAVLPLRLADTRTRFSDLQGNPKKLDYQNIHHPDATLVGLGDAQVFAHSGLGFGSLLLGGRLGLSLPLGNIVDNPYLLGEQGKVHQHLQLGTGTFDPLLGVDATYGFGRWSLAVFGFGQAPVYRGPHGYQAGTRLLGGLVASSTPAGDKPSARISASVAHEFAEKWDGHVHTEDGNQGRTDVFVGMGATFPFAQDWSFSVEVNVRVWGRAVGAQLDLPVVLQFSLGRLFHLESGEHDEHAGAHDEHETEGHAADVLDVVAQGEAAPLVGVPGKWTVIDFWAPWCEACVGLDVKLRKLAASREDVAVRRVNIVDFDSPIAKQELPGVDLLPRLRLLSPQGAVVLEQSGPADKVFDAVTAAMKPAAGEAALYFCPMHPEVVQTGPGVCPKCGMPLVLQKKP
jgi:thiol-disulfide isomerase/thioredoxin